MADITRNGTDFKGNSDPGRAVKPANDYHGKNITMAVDVQAGQWVAENTAGKGVLADASAGQNQRIIGQATETKKAGQRVHCVRWGLMSGFTFPDGAIGDPVFLSNTAGEASTTAGDVPVVLGFRDSDSEMFVDVATPGGVAGAAQAATVAALGATTNITAVPGAFADVAAVQAYLAGANMVPNIEARLDGLEAKVNAILASLKAAGLMA